MAFPLVNMGPPTGGDFQPVNCLTPSCRRPTKRSYADARKEKAPKIDVARTRRRRLRTMAVRCMSALGQKQTYAVQNGMSASGQNATCAVQIPMSAKGQKRTSVLLDHLVGAYEQQQTWLRLSGCRLESFG